MTRSHSSSVHSNRKACSQPWLYGSGVSFLGEGFSRFQAAGAIRSRSCAHRPGWLAPGFCACILTFAQVFAARAQNAVPDETEGQAMQQGSQAMAAGNFAAAVTAYSAVTHKMPGFAEGHLNLGLALFQSGRLDDAKPELVKALQLKPGLRGANLFLGLIDYRENRFKEAESRIEREAAIDPHSAKVFMWLGVCRLAEDDPQGAIEPLDKAYALDPKDADILYHRGHAYLLVANASYDAMFKLNRDSMRVHQVLGEAYAQSYRNQDAVTEFELAVKMAPHQPGLHEELGDQYWVVGNLEKAAAAYREELEIDPYATTSMYKLGSLLVRSQDAADGVGLLRKALRADPSLIDAHYYLGNGLMDLGQDQDAVHEFEQAIAADPASDRDISSYYKLAQIYRKLHEEPQAQAAMQNFLRMRSERETRQGTFAANMLRKRTELPVEDSDQAAMKPDTP